MNPWVVVGLGLLVFGTIVWLLERRRQRRVGRLTDSDVSELAARRSAQDDATGGPITRHPS